MTLLRWGPHDRLDYPKHVSNPWSPVVSGEGEPSFSQWAVATQASSSLIGPVLIGLVLDSQLGWTPWGTIGGIVIGFIGCIALLIRMAKRGGKPGA